MDNITRTMIETAAIQLGKTTEYAYEVLIKGTQMQAMIEISCILIGILILIPILKPIWNDYKKEETDDTLMKMSVFGGIGIIVVSFIMIEVISPALISLMNPEYVVINNILDKIGGI